MKIVECYGGYVYEVYGTRTFIRKYSDGKQELITEFLIYEDTFTRWEWKEVSEFKPYKE